MSVLGIDEVTKPSLETVILVFEDNTLTSFASRTFQLASFSVLLVETAAALRAAKSF